MLRHAMVSEIPDGLSVQPPPPPGKLAAHGQLKLPFGDSCLLRLFSLHVAFIPGYTECWCWRWERGVLGCLIPFNKNSSLKFFINSTCPMEWYTPVAQTQPKPQHVNVLVSRIQKSSTRDNNFVRWRGTFRSDRPKWPDQSKWTTFKAGHEYSGQTKPKWTIPFDQTNRNFQNFGLNGNKAPLDSPLRRILRFTSRLHTAYLPNYFQLFLLKFCHTVDQFNKWTSPKTVENKNPCGVQTWLCKQFCVHYFQNISCGSRKYPYPHHGGNWKFEGDGEVRGPRHSRGEGGLDRVNFKLGVKIATYWSGKSVSKT